jgi:hypothetical protein
MVTQIAPNGIRYVLDNFAKVESMDSDCLPYGQLPSGYGRKIACPYKIRLEGKGPWRRVYAVCFSNAASHYIIVKGQSYYLGTFDPRTDGR